jgi:hypothetical protein
MSSTTACDSFEITRIDENHLLLNCNITASTQPTSCIDARIDHGKPIHIITSERGYNNMNQNLKNRTSINTEEIRIHDYRSRKALSRIQPGTVQGGNIPYPVSNRTTISEIEIPSFQKDSDLFILIDDYEILFSDGCSELIHRILSIDIEKFIKKIKASIGSLTISVTIIFEKKIQDKLEDIFGLVDTEIFKEMYSENISFDVSTGNTISEMNNILFDRVFGRIIGGKIQPYIGHVDMNYEFLDAKHVNKDESNKMAFIIRGQNSMGITGNGTVNLKMILRGSGNIIMKLDDVIVHENDLSILPIDKNSQIILKYIQYMNYEKSIDRLKEKQEIKEHMNENKDFIFEVEFSDTLTIGEIDLDIQWIYEKISLAISRICSRLNDFREIFYSARGHKQAPPRMERMQSCR